MKEVWQMTQAEYAEKIGIPTAKQHAKDQPESWYRAQSDRNHRQLICKAVNLGLLIPVEVLEEIGENKRDKGALAMKFICILIDPQGEEWYDAYGPMTKNREEASRFASEEIAASAANNRFGRAGGAFWNCEREAEQRANQKYRGWAFRVEKA